VARTNWGGVQRNLGIDDSDWGEIFGSSYDYTQELEQPMKPGDTFRVADNRGDIVVSAWDQPNAKIVVTKKIVADEESKAEKMNDMWKPAIVANGNIITFEPQFAQVHANGGVFGSPLTRADLEIYLPRESTLDLQTQHGDIKVSGVEGDVRLNSGHGDITVSDIKGNASITMHHGDLAAANITGDLSLDGSVGDSAVSHIGGNVTLNGDFFGDTSITQVAKFVRFNSSRTDMQVGSLPGDLTMDSDDLRVSSGSGGFSVRTHGKNIHLENVGGDVSVENRDGDIELHAGSQSLGDVSINNRSGPIQVYFPPSATFQLQASTRGGEIQSDFSELKIESAGDNANANGTVGGGGKHVQLNDDHGDIEIHKGVIAVTTPSLAPIAPHAPAAPKAPNAPKAPKAPEAPTM
jgi:DUF4097 and DUF4098 domain-containing protein YvlB